MKKNKYILILTAFIGLVLSSCNDDNLVFDEPISERIQKAKNELHANLMGAGSSGWKVQYYTDTASFGAYNILLSFTEDIVTTQGDDLFPAGEHSSAYNISTPQGIALVFTTYNEVITLLADPDVTSVNSSGETLGGDIEFLWQRTSENKDTIVFKTKKTDQFVYFIRFDRGRSEWSTYLNNINNMAALFVTGDMNRFFKEIVVDGSTPLLLTGYDAIRRTMNPVYRTADTDSLIIQTNGVAFTETGFEFFTPLFIDGKAVQHFTYNYSTQRFEISDPGVYGTIEPVSNPTINFGNVNDVLFSNNQYYSFSGLEHGMINQLNNVLQILSDSIPDFESYYTTRFYPASSNIYTLELDFLRRDYDYLSAIYVAVNINKSNVRSDMLTLSPNGGSITIYASPTDLDYVIPYIEDDFRAFLESIIGTTSAGKSYIVIPSPDYRTFTFGATQSSTGFSIRYAGTSEG